MFWGVHEVTRMCPIILISLWLLPMSTNVTQFEVQSVKTNVSHHTKNESAASTIGHQSAIREGNERIASKIGGGPRPSINLM